ncbi:MAG: outer membrane protein assembly factor BamB [Oxalobacter sp.]|nr:MAG: outer membrane protein assembly factor BamB [Oxalobacter sp.]
MRTLFKCLAVGALIASAGCSSSGGPKYTPAELVDIKPVFKLKTLWTASVGSADRYIFSPAIVGDRIYAAGAGGSIAKIALDSGNEEWRISADMPLTAGVGSDGKTIAVAGEKGALLAFDSDGKLRWKVQTSSEVLTAPVVGSGLVIVRSVDNRIAAYDAETGKRKWTLDRPSPALTLRAAPGMVIVGPTVVVALPGGRLLSLNLTNGGPRWEVLIGEPRGATELERMADINGLPSVYGRDVCAAAYQGRVACLDVVTGAMRWSKKLTVGAATGMAQDERYAYAVDEHGAIYAFSREGGQSIWRNDKLSHRGLSAPVALGRYVAVVDYEGYVHFLSREDGSFVNRLSVGSSPALTPPLLAGSTLIVQTQSGTVAAIAAQ